MVMEYQLERKGTGFRKEDKPVEKETKKSLTNTSYYAIIGFVGILVTGYAINFANYINSLAITSFDAVLFSSLMAISEEMFFRGFILDLLLVSIKLSWIAIFASAGVFTLYHLARYGTQLDSLLYVFGGGLILSWITWKSRRLGPSIIAHTANNILATLGAGVI
jgi:membrane protease YdiL (CAAX protease family)